MSLKPVWFIKQISDQSGLHSDYLKTNTNQEAAHYVLSIEGKGQKESFLKVNSNSVKCNVYLNNEDLNLCVHVYVYIFIIIVFSVSIRCNYAQLSQLGFFDM